MLLFVCILKDYRKIEALMLGFIELGVTGATVLEGRGMGQSIGSEVPIFAALRGLFPGGAVDSHVIVSVIDPTLTPRCFDLVERECGPLESAGTGIAFTLPIGEVRGLAPEIG